MGLTSREKAYILCYDIIRLPMSAFPALSSSSSVLAVATCYGSIHLIAYQLNNLENGKTTEDVTTLQASFKLSSQWQKVLSLTTIDDSFLVAASEGVIYAWRLSELEKLLLSANEAQSRELSSSSRTSVHLPPAWVLCIPNPGDGDTEEVNSILCDNVSHRLYAGSGLGQVHCFDVDTGGSLISSWKAHQDSILRLCPMQDNPLHFASASEDGYVRVWDSRKVVSNGANRSKSTIAGIPSQELKPSSEGNIARPGMGKWITALCGDANGNTDWLLCGGGPTLALWSRRALKPVVVFQPHTVEQDLVYNSVSTPSLEKWHAQSVVCGETVSAVGLGSMLYQWDITGREVCTQKTRLKHGLALCHARNVTTDSEQQPQQFILVVGAGSSVEIMASQPAIARQHTSLQFL